MLYKKWAEINSEILEIDGVSEEHIVKKLICKLIEDIPYNELTELFDVKKINTSSDLGCKIPTVNFLVTIEIDITEEELEIKEELIKQLKNQKYM